MNKLLNITYSSELLGERVYLVTDEHLQTLVGYYGGGIIDYDGDGIVDDPFMTELELDLVTNDGIIDEEDMEGWKKYGRPDIADFINNQYLGGANELFGFDDWDEGGVIGGTGEPYWQGGTPPVHPGCIGGGGGGEAPPEAETQSAEVLAFSFTGEYIESGEGLLVTIKVSHVYASSDIIGLSSVVFANTNAVSIPYEISYEGFETIDEWGIEGVNLYIAPKYFVPGDGYYVDIFYRTTSPIQGFQFDITGDYFISISGGVSEFLDVQYVDQSEYDTPFTEDGEILDPHELTITGIGQYGDIDTDGDGEVDINVDFYPTSSFKTGDRMRINFNTNFPATAFGYFIQFIHYLPDEQGNMTVQNKYIKYRDRGAQSAGNEDVDGNGNYFIQALQMPESYPTGYYKVIVAQTLEYNTVTGEISLGASDSHPDELDNTGTLYSGFFEFEQVIPDPEEEEIITRPLETFENPIWYILNQTLPNPYYDTNFWDGENNYFPPNSSVGQIFISDNSDLNLKQSCNLEINGENITGKSILDSSGNSSKGLMIGDYKIKKVRENEPMRRDSFIRVPTKGTKRGAL